jgi:hypothetical protein
MSDSARMQAAELRSRLVKTLLTFALLGPLIGGAIPYLAVLLFFFLPVIIQVHGLSSAFAVIGAAFMVLAIGMLFAVLLAIPPAVAAGIVIATWEHFRGRSSAWFAALVGLLVGLVSVAVYWQLLYSSADDEKWAAVVTVMLGSIFASVVCWRITRPRLQVAR